MALRGFSPGPPASFLHKNQHFEFQSNLEIVVNPIIIVIVVIFVFPILPICYVLARTAVSILQILEFLQTLLSYTCASFRIALLIIKMCL